MCKLAPQSGQNCQSGLKKDLCGKLSPKWFLFVLYHAVKFEKKGKVDAEI